MGGGFIPLSCCNWYWFSNYNYYFKGVEMKIEYWSVGHVLDTPTTRRFSLEEMKRSQEREGCMVFKNFHTHDSGKSRELVAEYSK